MSNEILDCSDTTQVGLIWKMKKFRNNKSIINRNDGILNI